MIDLNKALDWNPPQNWIKIKTIDAHTAGEPLRIILNGFPQLKGNTILERRTYAIEHYDNLRKALMWEPRGHADMYGCIITDPVTEGADFGVLFTHNEGFSSMCGHGIIAVTKVVLETGALELIPPETKVIIDTPAGRVTSFARIENNKVQSVRFHNVPSFVFRKNEIINVPGLGKVKYDIAFGGAFYAFVQAEEIGVECRPENYKELIEAGMSIKREVMKSVKIIHPFERDLNFLYGTIFIAPPLNKGADSRNVCIFAEGEVDRSPTGTGVSARMALHLDKGEIGMNESMIIESIIGTRFKGRIVKRVDYGPYKGVIPEVEGTAYITGKNEFFIDPDDPLKNGFILR